VGIAHRYRSGLENESSPLMWAMPTLPGKTTMTFH
jgi:hypothetical protein